MAFYFVRWLIVHGTRESKISGGGGGFIQSSNPHHDERTSFLITQLPKNKRIYSIGLKSSQKPNSTVPQQVQEIDTNLSHKMNELAPRAR